jgi:uncharacterized protein YjiS (DUF1127 family)
MFSGSPVFTDADQMPPFQDWGIAFLVTLIVWRHRFVTRRHLRSLDRRELEDVGIDPAARQHEVAKWFWES